MSSKRERRPSMAQRPILVALADMGGEATHEAVTELISSRGERHPGIAQWVAIDEHGAGWVTVNRGTEDNRGGIQSEYRYTLTPAGWAIIDREPPARPAERVEVGAAGCGCPVTEEMRLDPAGELHSSIEGTERTEHRPGCWDAPDESTAGSAPKPQDDGYRWHEGVISNPKAWTLVDPDGDHVAHVYQCDDKTWRAVWNDGEVIAEGFDKSGPALRAVDDVARGCAWDISDPSHGPMSCGDERAPGSPYCPPHKEENEQLQAASDDMDRLEESRAAVSRAES